MADSGKLRLMIVAGEASGDKHAAHLVDALRICAPELEFELFGSGGAEMRAAGVDTAVDIRNLSIMGALEVASALPMFLRVFRLLRSQAKNAKPDAVILVDWPEFNLRLARKLRRDGHRVFYYISPQVWAWRRYRVRQIKRDIEKMLVILPFEKDFYQKLGVDVEYVGHPLLDSVKVTSDRVSFCSKHGFDPDRPLVALLPGSRRKEVSYILPPMLETAQRIAASNPAIQFAIAAASTTTISTAGLPLNVKVIEGETYNTIAAADVAVVASGTATLETAIIGTPMIICYRASELNWRLFTPLIGVDLVGLPNLIAGEQVALELLQHDLNAERLELEVSRLLGSPIALKEARNRLRKVVDKLGKNDASRRAAEVILGLCSRQPRANPAYPSRSRY